MADTAVDLHPAEQRLRIAAHALAQGEQEIADACEGMLLSLAAPADDTLPVDVEFYSFRRYSDAARRKVLTTRAARAAMAVLLADEGMQLPVHVGVAYRMPPNNDALLADLAAFVRDAAPEIENEASLRAAADGLASVAESYVQPMRDLADRAAALMTRLSALETA